MSYTRRFKKDITIHYSGSVNYGPSEHGGSKSYSGSKTETVVFDVTVDTDPFDEEVDEMRNHIDLLTGSVCATEAAHVKAIDETSRKIGDTIIQGFFKTVKSDISQQITELKTKSEALLLQLNKLAQRCNEKKKQMGIDYQRLSERYSKIFNDLNQELYNRIHSIDAPVFTTVKTIEADGIQANSGEMIATVSVSAGEQSRLLSKIAVNLAKRQAIKAIETGQKFLAVQNATDNLISKCLLPERQGNLLCAPLCIMETTCTGNYSQTSTFASPLLDSVNKEAIAKQLEPQMKSPISETSTRAISNYFNTNAAEELKNATDEHSRRVAQLTSKLFNLSQTATLGE